MLSYTKIKRILDILLSLAMIVPVSIIITPFIIMIKREDNGPAFYNAKRIGKNGDEFNMFKLRTMKVNSPDLRMADGSTYNSENDTRLTNIGKFLRKNSIDELPQIFNILKGDMSFIGPRPDTPYGYSLYSESDKESLCVRPGLTGYNQAINRNSVLTKEKLDNDRYYVKNLSFKLDVYILLLTIKTVVMRKGINRSEKNSDSKIMNPLNGEPNEE